MWGSVGETIVKLKSSNFKENSHIYIGIYLKEKAFSQPGLKPCVGDNLWLYSLDQKYIIQHNITPEFAVIFLSPK